VLKNAFDKSDGVKFHALFLASCKTMIISNWLVIKQY